jgi:hypothetical protein
MSPESQSAKDQETSISPMFLSSERREVGRVLQGSVRGWRMFRLDEDESGAVIARLSVAESEFWVADESRERRISGCTDILSSLIFRKLHLARSRWSDGFGGLPGTPIKFKTILTLLWRSRSQSARFHRQQRKRVTSSGTVVLCGGSANLPTLARC